MEYRQPEYRFYQHCDHDLHHPQILRAVDRMIADYLPEGMEKSLVDFGCGYGRLTAYYKERGFHVLGLDTSKSGIDRGQREYPDIALEHISFAAPDLQQRYGTFSVLIAIEVIEHVFSPRLFMQQAISLVKEGGLVIFSTPYHGYWKNVALAMTNKLDAHFTALWEGGHIKFFSVSTLRKLGETQGLTYKNVYRTGRIPPLAKSMVMAFQKACD